MGIMVFEPIIFQTPVIWNGVPGKTIGQPMGLLLEKIPGGLMPQTIAAEATILEEVPGGQ